MPRNDPTTTLWPTRGGALGARLRGRTWSLLTVLFLGVGLGAACGDDASGDDAGCEAGSASCPCYGNNTCLPGLLCVAQVCQPAGGTSVTTTITTSTSGAANTSDGESEGSDTSGDPSGGTTSSSEVGGPEIVDFGTNVKVITQGESVIFTATIIDPDGPDDVQGGSLKSGDEAVTYGAFADLGNGTYELTLGWGEIHQAIGIEFEGSETVPFKAVFFDNGGKKGVASTSIDLTCGDDYSILACDGACRHANVDEKNCGSCGNVCDPGDECKYGSCLAEWGTCLVTGNTSFTTCGEYCAAQGESCVNSCNFENSAWYWKGDLACDPRAFPQEFDWGTDACTQSFLFDPNFATSLRCCCTIGGVWPGP